MRLADHDRRRVEDRVLVGEQGEYGGQVLARGLTEDHGRIVAGGPAGTAAGPLRLRDPKGYGRKRSTCGSWSLFCAENSALMCTLSYVNFLIAGLVRIWSSTCALPW